MARRIDTVGVVGLGLMGAGIVEVLARNGLDVVAVEVDGDALADGRARLEQSTTRAVRRGKLPEQDQRALHDRVTFSTALDDLAEADLVLEAVPERLDVKRQVFAALDAVVKPEAVLATNTSSLSVTEIAVATEHPRRVVGMHFFNPAPVLQLVEVVRTVVTEDDVVEDVVALAQRLGKVPVVVGDRAGFIANALLFGYLNHAVGLYESGYASREDIDAAMTLGCGLPMGPLALLDLIGLDTALEILDTMYQQGRNRLHAPAPVLRQLVMAGLRGRKSGRGFYAYAEPGSSQVVPDALTASSSHAAASPREVHAIGVVGSGAAATGIADVLARAGYEVRVVPDGGGLEDVRDADLVVEAAAQDPAAAHALFSRLDATCKPGAVLATTTSTLAVVDLAAATSRPGDVVGLHLVDRAQPVRLVEVVRAVSTADDALATAVAVCGAAGLHPVICADRAGLIVDALLFPYLNDAVRMLEAHYASADAIDTAMRKGCGYPVGPFEMLDAVGLDVALAMQRRIYRESREPGHAPAPLLQQMVTAGYLGRAGGRGFRTDA